MMTRVIPYRTASNTSITRNRVQKLGIGTVVFCLTFGLVIAVSFGSNSSHNQIETEIEPATRAKPAEQCWCTPNHKDSLLAIYSSRDKNPNGLMMDFVDKINKLKLNYEGNISLEGSCSIMYESSYYFLGQGFTAIQHKL